MNKKETAVILELVSTMYQNKFKVNDKQLLLNMWHDILRDHDFETISTNLKAHFKTSAFPPAVADLIKNEDRGRAIPTIHETRLLLQTYEERSNAKITDEERQEHLRRMRIVLGIEKDGE